MGLLLTLAGVASTLAQSSPLTEPLPKIDFSPWRKIDENATSEHFEVQYPSAFHSGYAANDVVYLDVFLPLRRSRPLPSVLILHYWGAMDLRVESNLARLLNRHGIAAAVLTLPYHLKRTPPGSRTGKLAISADPEHLIRTMTQSVLDVRRSVDWIQTRPELLPTPLGITGTSLGALVSALAIGVEPRFSQAAIMLGGADLAHIIWHSSRVVEERDEMRRHGLTEERLREILAPIEPLNYIAHTKVRSAFVIAASFDTVVPPEDANKLAAAIKNTKTLWLDSGHYGGFLVQKQVQGAVANYFSSEFSGIDYVPPKGVSAPVIRFGMQANPETRLQVVLGVDILRWNARGDAFVTLLAAARGPQIYLGVNASKGLSVGISLVSGRAAPGFLWSLVL